MKVIICGAGQVGFSIARYLENSNIDVVVIDNDPENLRHINETMDVQTITGVASHPEILDKAGASDADMLIAVTKSDEINMIVCQIAYSLFNLRKKIARIRDQNYLLKKWDQLYHQDHLPINYIISPEAEVAKTLRRNLQVSGATIVIPLAEAKVKVVGLRCYKDCPIINIPLRQLTETFPDISVKVVLIVREGENIIPSPDDQLHIGDEVYFACDTNHLNRVTRAFGVKEKESQSLVVVGGGNIGYGFCQEIAKCYPEADLRVVEERPDRAQYLAEKLEKALVVCGSGLDQSVLEEVNISQANTFISLMSNDEDNILSSLLAKRFGVSKTIALLNNSAYNTLVSTLGVDAIVNPSAITVSSILQHVRQGHIVAAHTLKDNFGELIEAEVLAGSKVVGLSVGDLVVPGQLSVGAIVRGDKLIIPPKKNVSFQVSDRVVLLANTEQIKQVEKIFST